MTNLLLSLPSLVSEIGGGFSPWGEIKKKEGLGFFGGEEYSRVPNKHAGMLIYSASKNPVRHAYCGRHAANDTLPMTRSC